MSITAIPALSLTEEADLVRAAQGGDEYAQAALIQSQVPMLRREAHKYAGAGAVDPEDLFSAGVEALLEAVFTFDPNRGTRLYTHAQHSIREAMSDEKARFDTQIAVPGRTLRKYRKAIRETDTLDAARAYAQERDGMDPATFDAVHNAVHAVDSLDASFDNSGNAAASAPDALGNPRETTFGFVLDSQTTRLGGAKGPTPEGSAMSRLLSSQALAALDDRQRAVVGLAYLSGEDLSDADVAKRLGMSRPTVTRVRNAALAAMRAALA